eukprot:2525291-Rhodomonas_salina.3
MAYRAPRTIRAGLYRQGRARLASAAAAGSTIPEVQYKTLHVGDTLLPRRSIVPGTVVQNLRRLRY